MSDLLDDNFGILLRRAMQAQPEPATSIDVAAAALEKVRVREAALARVARMRWWGRMLGVAAGLLIVVVLGVGYWLMPTSTSTSDTSAGSSSDTTSVSGSSSSSLDAGTIGLAALAVAVIGVTAAGVLGTDKTIRLSVA
ncbi:MAG TPA: hypothetical protein VHQ47_00600 [Phycisphaerae bacterium]|jgi:hypothetical protein|nr:hypothetical protein [Phycisphaerae bacterium]